MNIDLDSFNYNLPQNLIAQKPRDIRSNSKLLVLSKNSSSKKEDYFYNLCNYLKSNDLLIFNNTKVIPARLFGHKKTGGKVEILFERKISDYEFFALIKNMGITNTNTKIVVNDKYKIKVNKKIKNLFHCTSEDIKVLDLLNCFGNTPIPPYIKRPSNEIDKKRYQTIYASIEGSTAAPTAGLHFDEHIFEKMKSMSIEHSYCTLHIGLGTFSPLRSKKIDQNELHQEFYSIPRKTLEKIRKCKKNNGRVIAVGTTVVRALESFFLKQNMNTDKFYDTNIFIKPGFDFKIIDGLITNFHLPKSSLIILISAFHGIENTLEAYEYAVKNEYMFFSYGDANLII
tara:strand:+ start:35 stop:1060 length:1026 start_codon:yes stop_codon:yes gene_type:complete